MQNLLDKWKSAVTWMSTKGIPLPLLRNPKHQEASVTFTMVIISFGMCLLSGTKLVSSLNFDNYFNLFMAVCALYFGRSFQKVAPSPAPSEEKITK